MIRADSSRRRVFLSTAVCRAAMCVAAALNVNAEDWPQFRGPNASGVAAESRNPPVEFSTEKNVAWKVELTKGVACPTVAGGRVFATSAIQTAENGKFTVHAFDAVTGEQQWEQSFETGKLPEITSPNEHASSTPATDGQRVYVHFSTLGMLCLDAGNGELVWQHKLPTSVQSWAIGRAPSAATRSCEQQLRAERATRRCVQSLRRSS